MNTTESSQISTQRLDKQGGTNFNTRNSAKPATNSVSPSLAEQNDFTKHMMQ
jgi:hypothetical protein